MAVRSPCSGMNDQQKALIDILLLDIKKGNFKNEPSPTLVVAKRTAELLRSVMVMTGKTNLEGVLKNVYRVGYILSAGVPFDIIIKNITRRVLYIIREEYEAALLALGEDDLVHSDSTGVSPALMPSNDFNQCNLSELDISGYNENTSRNNSPSHGIHRSLSELNPPLSGMMEPPPTEFEKPNTNTQELLWHKGKWKQNVIAHLTEYIQDFGSVHKNIGDYTKDHLNERPLYSDEVVLTYGYSHTVEVFLKAAVKRAKKFEVIVVEHSPENNGHVLAKTLAAAGVRNVQIIPDAAVYAIMCRVNKVIISTHAVLADGGIIAKSGIHGVALAAKAHRVPLVVLTGLYKLSPLFPLNPKSFAALSSPASIMPFEEAFCKVDPQNINGCDLLHVRNPQWDYVPPDFISTYITNSGGYNPSYIYRLLAELYNPEDYDL